jgi:hypothetical protein
MSNKYKIKDSKGNLRNVRVDYYTGTAVVISDADTWQPLGSSIIQSTGEINATMRDPEFRNNDEFTALGNEAIRQAIRKGIIIPTFDALFSYMDIDHGANKLMPRIGAELTQVEVEGKKLNRWSIPLANVLSGEIRARV